MLEDLARAVLALTPHFGTGSDASRTSGLTFATCHHIEGGAIVTHDADLAARCRQLRNFGFAGHGDIPVNGINAKMSEMHAAVGLVQLDRFDELRALNRERFDIYRSLLDGVDGVRLVGAPDPADSSPAGYVVVELPGVGSTEEDAAAADRVAQILQAENVHVRRYFSPGVHQLEAFRRFAPQDPLPVTEDLATRCLSLPTGEAVSNHDIVTIVALLLDALARVRAERPVAVSA